MRDISTMVDTIDLLNGRLQRKDKIVMRRIGGETVLIPINQTGVDLQKVYLLNDTAAEVWQLLEQPLSIDEIVAVLEQNYEANTATIKYDIKMLLLDMQEFLTITEAEE